MLEEKATPVFSSLDGLHHHYYFVITAGTFLLLLPLVVDGLAVGGHGSLFEGLGERGVSVASAANVLGGGAVLESEGALGDHLTGVGADNVHAEDTVGLSVGEELDETVGVGVGLGAGVFRTSSSG